MSYRLTKRASSEFDQIYLRGVRDFGYDVADKYAVGLLKTFTFLGDFPIAARERREINPPVRVHPFRSHLIIYRVESEEAVIVRIAHGHEDWASSLD